MSLPASLRLLDSRTERQCAAHGCGNRPKCRSPASGLFFCSTHAARDQALELVLLETPRATQHRRTAARLAHIHRQAGERGVIRLCTNNKWRYSPFVPGVVGFRLREMFGESGTPVLRQLLFENSGAIDLDGRHCVSLEHMARACALYQFEFGDKISDEFYNRLGAELSNPRLPAPRMPMSERRLAQKYSPNDAEPRFYANLTGKGNKIMTPRQFRALVFSIYERQVQSTATLADLRQALRDGYDLILWTQQSVFHDSTAADLHSDFENTWQDFTEEFAIACMLAIDNPADYPWNVYQARNAEIFDLPRPQ